MKHKVDSNLKIFWDAFDPHILMLTSIVAGITIIPATQMVEDYRVFLMVAPLLFPQAIIGFKLLMPIHSGWGRVSYFMVNELQVVLITTLGVAFLLI